MIIAINYANKSFRRAQKLNSKTAKKWGADRIIEYGPQDIDEEFWKKNKEILESEKGNGFYLWKPYFLNKAYKELNDGDYLIYVDSGAVYVDKIQYLIDCMENESVDIMIFSLEKEMLEKQYTKRDAFILMECDEKRYTDTPQSIGGYVVLKKSPLVERFLCEDLEYAQDARIITEQSNMMGYLNYEGYVGHRHDQSVWSLMAKKYILKRFRDPSQFGLIHRYEEEVEMRSTFPQIIDSHRMNVGSMLELKWKRSRWGKLLVRICRQLKIVGRR